MVFFLADEEDELFVAFEGIFRVAPALRLSLVMPFACFIWATVTPYFLAIVERFSPDLTLWVEGVVCFFAAVSVFFFVAAAFAGGVVTAATVVSITACGAVVEIRSC